MARPPDKPFSKTEIKILVYNKIQKGIPYVVAKKQVAEEIKIIIENRKKEKLKEEEEKVEKIDNFTENFKKLKNG
jgi:Holliday junction resolvase